MLMDVDVRAPQVLIEFLDHEFPLKLFFPAHHRDHHGPSNIAKAPSQPSSLLSKEIPAWLLLNCLDTLQSQANNRDSEKSYISHMIA